MSQTDHSKTAGAGVLAGVTVVELAGIGPAPYCGQLLADMGAEVILVDRPGANMYLVHNRAKRSIALDLRKDGAADVVLALVKKADILIEGLRPGVAERLGVGPEACHAVNGKLIYGRMTGWGQSGPWSTMAGHDINYVSITGALEAMGDADRPPPPPLNLVGDFGGGSLFLLSGILAALYRAEKTGAGDVVDAAIIDGVNSMMGIIHSLAHIKHWSPARQRNLLDGGAPYYRCYRTKDDRFMAVGCIEPQFFAEMLRRLEISPEDYGGQNDFAKWRSQHELLETTYAQKTRDEWAELFDGADACVTPVLDYTEAAAHPQNAAREALVHHGDVTMPGPAPRFRDTPIRINPNVQPVSTDARALLAEVGFAETEVDQLIGGGIVIDRNKR